MSVSIFLVGHEGAGKKAFAAAFRASIPAHQTVLHVTTAGVLAAELAQEQFPKTRLNLAWMEQALVKKHGSGVITERLKSVVLGTHATFVIYDSIRSREDNEFAHSLSGGYSMRLGIESDPQVRWKRCVGRARRAQITNEESVLSFGEFTSREQHTSGALVDQFLRETPIRLANDDSPEEFQRAVRGFIEGPLMYLMLNVAGT